MATRESDLRAQLRQRLAGAEVPPAPEDALRDSLAERLNTATARDPHARSALDQAARVGAGGFIAGMLSLPHAAGEMAAAGTAFIEGSIAHMIPGGRGYEYGARRAEQNEMFPANVLLKWPNPSSEDVMNAVGTLRNLPGELADTPLSPLEAYDRAKDAGTAEEMAAREAHPVASTIGEIAGDIGALLTLRPRGGWGKNVKDIPAEAKSLWRRFTGRGADEIPEVAEDVAKAANESSNGLMRALGLVRRGTARSAEAGFEGALISAMGEGDPAAGAVYSAGIQAGGSIGLAAKTAIVRAPFRSLATVWLGHEIFRALAPGAQDAFESKDEAVRELIGAYGVGIIAGIAGAHRGTGSGRIREVTDAIATASRGAIASVVSSLNQWEEAGETEYSAAIEQMVREPDYFGQEARMMIERAAERGPDALTRTMGTLFKNPGFRRRFDALGGGEQ